jgi:hypothetical protein
MQNLSRDNKHPNGDSNWAPPEHKSKVLPTKPTCLVIPVLSSAYLIIYSPFYKQWHNNLTEMMTIYAVIHAVRQREKEFKLYTNSKFIYSKKPHSIQVMQNYFIHSLHNENPPQVYFCTFIKLLSLSQNELEILVSKPGGKRPFRRQRHWWEGNTETE